jgi:hypothetical protein
LDAVTSSTPVSSSGYNDRIVPFVAGDGFPCSLVNVQGDAPPTRGPVLVVHGAGVRANIFRAPTEKNFIDYLVELGYDVWLENWRGSIDAMPNEWTLDQVALHDHPRAVQTVLAKTGAKSLKAVVHCQGSTSFVMSAIAGLVPEVTTILSNAVSLHPVVSRGARMKIMTATPLVGLVTKYIDAQWGNKSPSIVAKAITTVVRATHRECDNTVCRLASFTYGTGHPTLWSHEHLDDRTHDWLRQEFGFCPVSFFRQMKRCIRRGNLVRYGKSPDLPWDFADYPPDTDARFAFFAGDRNRCFLPESQIRSYNHFNAYRPGYHSLHILEGYGHLDVFMGKNAARDVFPRMAAALEG